MEKLTDQKTQSLLAATDFIPVFPLFGQKFLHYFKRYLEILVLLQNIGLFIIRYLAERVILGCGTLHEKFWIVYCNLTPDLSLQMFLSKSSPIGKVRARRVHEGPEGGTVIAILFL